VVSLHAFRRRTTLLCFIPIQQDWLNKRHFHLPPLLESHLCIRQHRNLLIHLFDLLSSYLCPQKICRRLYRHCTEIHTFDRCSLRTVRQIFRNPSFSGRSDMVLRVLPDHDSRTQQFRPRIMGRCIRKRSPRIMFLVLRYRLLHRRPRALISSVALYERICRFCNLQRACYNVVRARYIRGGKYRGIRKLGYDESGATECEYIHQRDAGVVCECRSDCRDGI
jgi:hypothetical protein